MPAELPTGAAGRAPGARGGAREVMRPEKGGEARERERPRPNERRMADEECLEKVIGLEVAVPRAQ